MTEEPTTTLPEFRDWSVAAVRLLQGVVYLDDEAIWNIILANRSTLEGFVGRLGLRMVVDESDGFAYLRQLSEDDLPDGYERLPKLFRRTRLSYDATLMCVLLREELRRFEEEEVHDERCVVRAADLLEQFKAFQPGDLDDVRVRKAMDSALKTLEGMKFVRLFGKEPEEWEIRPILKARLTAADLETLKSRLLEVAARRGGEGEAR